MLPTLIKVPLHQQRPQELGPQARTQIANILAASQNLLSRAQSLVQPNYQQQFEPKYQQEQPNYGQLQQSSGFGNVARPLFPRYLVGQPASSGGAPIYAFF